MPTTHPDDWESSRKAGHGSGRGPTDRITTEELAADLGTSSQAIYESRRRNTYPGKLGRRQGKRLMFYRSEVNDWLESVPKIVTDENGVIRRWETDPAYGEGETTNDADTAILWALEGIQTTLRAIHNELRAFRSLATPLFVPSGIVTVNAAGQHDEEAIQAAVALSEGTFWIGKPTNMEDEEE